LIIARNPARYRTMMIAAMVEKFSFVIAIYILFALGRVALLMVGFATIDLVLGSLFVAAFFKTKEE
jgi:hypothetical protein